MGEVLGLTLRTRRTDPRLVYVADGGSILPHVTPGLGVARGVSVVGASHIPSKEKKERKRVKAKQCDMEHAASTIL